jgi:hypothetical protein
VSITARGRSLGRKPLEDWRAALGGFLKCDPAVRRYPLAHGTQGPFWNEILGEFLSELPFTLYAIGSLDLKLLHDAAWQQIEDRFVLDRPRDVLEFWERHKNTLAGSEVSVSSRPRGRRAAADVDQDPPAALRMVSSSRTYSFK